MSYEITIEDSSIVLVLGKQAPTKVTWQAISLENWSMTSWQALRQSPKFRQASRLQNYFKTSKNFRISHMGIRLIPTALGIHQCKHARDYALKARLGGET